MSKTYKVGGHAFSVVTDSDFVSCLLETMDNYAPFLCDGNDGDMLFSVNISVENDIFSKLDGVKLLAEFDDDIAYIALMEDSCHDVVFRMALNRKYSESGGILKINKDSRSACLYLNGKAEYNHQTFIINNSLMLMYAMFSSTLDTLLIHASVVVNSNKGYAFLGRSGTGKSTHTGLWLNHIEGSVLLNDDNPVVRILSDGKTVIYGSPWSGKTPCYKNQGVELRSIVRLSQAPYNRIKQLKGVAAYVALSPSASSMRWDNEIADGLHRTVSELIYVVGIYHLECLPDEDAAWVCFNAVK